MTTDTLDPESIDPEAIESAKAISDAYNRFWDAVAGRPVKQGYELLAMMVAHYAIETGLDPVVYDEMVVRFASMMRHMLNEVAALSVAGMSEN